MVGFDHEWDGHIMKAILPRTGGDFWYINEEHTPKETDFSFLLQRSRSNYLEGTIGSYELFFINLCWHVLGSIPSYPATLEKINTMQKTLHEVRDMEPILYEIQETQRQFQGNMDTLTETVNQRFKDQEITMKDIKDDIKTLLTRSTPNTHSSSNTSATTPSVISGLQEEDREQPEKKAEERE
jgi:hypothetical protein